MKAQRTVPVLLSLFAGAAALLALARCEQTTTFVPFVKEFCGDNLDNDTDSRIDCQDSDCLDSCFVDIAIFPAPPTSLDSIEIQGTVHNAVGISILVTPSPGLARTPRIDTSTGEWTAVLYDLKVPQTYTAIATAKGPGNTEAKDTVTVDRRP